MAENVMLAKTWTDKIDPVGWYMSEKLDGVRAIWDFRRKKFFSRNLKEFIAPDWFIRGMPKVDLDGELWIGRELFKETSGQVRRKSNSDWSEINYYVFEVPSYGCCFGTKYPLMLELSDKLPRHVKIILQVQCNGLPHFTKFEESIIRKGGEGVMLRHPSSVYEYKRSGNLLKVKRWKQEEEAAMVIGYKPGLGKHAGRMGALICNYKGQTIFLGTGFTDEERENPPSIGVKVVFKYSGMSEENIPRFPVYVR